MSQSTRIASVGLFVLLSLLALNMVAFGQSAIEELAVQQISDQTGIDPSELATLFVTDEGDQFILAFVYISEETLESDLNPDLKAAVAPFVDKNAMLTLVVPTRTSSFNPTEIAFQQNNITHLLAINQIHAISDNFISGQIAGSVVSSGIIELPQTLDFETQFEIVFRGQFSTPFVIEGEIEIDEEAEEQQNQNQPGGILMAFIQFLLTIILIPFLIFI